MIRIALLLALGLLVYTRFDDYWPRVRTAVSAAVDPAALWRGALGTSEAAAQSLSLVWSRDSSRVTLECPRGLTGACCEALKPASPDLCAEASALLAKARWKKALVASSPATTAASTDASTDASRDASALQLEGRAVVSDLGDWGFELSGVGGRDASGAYQYRREYKQTSGSMAWCDARRGCLKDPQPRAPLANGRLQAPTGQQGLSLWTAGDPEVRAVLPGRVVATDSAHDVNGSMGGTIVRVYHGRELYAAYGPLQAAPGVKPGVLVRSGSHLGFAPHHPAGYALFVRVRQGGQNLDPATFWGVRPVETPPEGSVELSNIANQQLLSGSP